ncbi:inactive cell surface hyaluronidase CEMIP2-like [Hyperolius riggenbachi]|uniref:inactive cell surface hyaluronidase CEMIP2-like n=1 Tax=Hyperolius riggenbachi TaxID=752182 RepID=UPI0035A34CF5
MYFIASGMHTIRPSGRSVSTRPYGAGLDLLWSFTMRCCTYEPYNLHSTAEDRLQLHPSRDEDTEDIPPPDLCMDSFHHPGKSWTRGEDVGIIFRWWHLPLLGHFLKGRMTWMLQSLHNLPLALLFILVLSSWKSCEAEDLHLWSNSSLDDTSSFNLLDYKVVKRSTRETPGDLQTIGDNAVTDKGHQVNIQWKGRTWSCAVLLKLSQHVLVSALGFNLAWNSFPYDSCDQDLKPTETLISPLKLLQVTVKPLLLHKVLQFLGDLGFLIESQQSKALSLLKKRIYKTGKPVKNPIVHSKDRCPDKKPYLIPWHPGHDGRRSAVIGRGVALRLESSATFHSLLIQDGGTLVFADDQIPITLRARYILIRDGGSLHIGSPQCPYNANATISLYGKSTEGYDVDEFGKKFIGVDSGGILELHGRRPLSWTLLDATLYPGGLPYGSYKWEKHWGSRGINIRIIDPETGQVQAADRFDTHMFLEEGKRLEEFLSKQSLGKVVAVAVGDSAAKSLTPDVRRYLRETLNSRYIYHLGYRQPWALVGVLGESPLKVTEDRKQYDNNGTTGLAIATREFQTYGGLHFTVTAYSGWIKGVPKNGFRVAVSRGIILTLADDVTSWLPGNRIVIASTDYSMHQAEEFTLLHCLECKSSQVKIDGSPLYMHIGEVIDGIDMRAEVGLLTRNILIRGEMEDACYGNNYCQFFSYDTFGGHIKIQRHFGSVHLSGVEITNMGQQLLGSYPVHFHVNGAVDEEGGYNPPTYLDNLAIHHCFSRCIAVHGTDGLLVKDTIGYDTLGHCFFLEDGAEQRNTFYHNLGLVTKAGTILPTDRNEAMCLAMREHVYGDYVPVPSTDCMSVSTFWISNPNNNLIGNAAGGAQDVGIWFIFHRVPSGLSEGQYPEGQSEFTPLGIFHNNRVHSNFKAGLFIGKGVKTTVANAENPREYLTVDNARFRPHQDSDPAKPRVPALIDGLIAFKNNDHGAWARGGDIIFQNSGFSDNGIGLTLASDGTFPTDEGSSLEVSDSIFVGESENVGSQGGQNSYWGRGGSGEQRSLPRNKTFPIRGFQIYDGPVRLLRCTFKKFLPTAERPSSAIGFSLKNAWQITPQNNVSLVKMERSVELKVFFGRSGQWFGSNDYDGDKVSIFHDLDGSLTGYPDTFVGRADNYLLRHTGCLTVPRWNGVICTGRYAQLYIQARRPENLTILVARAAYPSHPLRLAGVNKGAPFQQYQPVVMLYQPYIIRWEGQSPREVILYPINFNRGDWLQIALCYPKSSVFQVTADIYERHSGRVHSVRHYTLTSTLHQALNKSAARLYHFSKDSGYLFLHLQAHESRNGHSYCSQNGCERVKITANFHADDSNDCIVKPFPDGAGDVQHVKLSVSQRLPLPCSQCGAPQVAITSTPSIKYTKIHVQSARREDVLTRTKSSYIKVDEEIFPFKRRGLFFLVLDACSGTVVSKRHFEMIDELSTTKAMSMYIQTSLKQRSVVLICSRDIVETPPLYDMSSFSKLGSAKPVALHKRGSFAMVGYKGLTTPSWIKIINNSAERRAASIHLYLPLMLPEYRCPSPKL